jgi:hypothetical protein
MIYGGILLFVLGGQFMVVLRDPLQYIDFGDPFLGAFVAR